MKLSKIGIVFLTVIWVSLAEQEPGQKPKKCSTIDQTDGVCVPISECPSYKTYTLYKKESVRETHQLIAHAAKTCGSQGKLNYSTTVVCCTIQEPVEVDPEPIKEVTDKNYTLPDLNTCGQSFSDVAASRITGGFKVTPGQFPWVVALEYVYKIEHVDKNDKSLGFYDVYDFQCGGSLITQVHVLTAAHCIRDNLFAARAGMWNKLGSYENNGSVVATYRHEGYAKETFSNDIGIIRVAWEKSFNAINTPNCGFICLPTTSSLRQNKFVRYYPFVAGWGYDKKNGTQSDDMMAVQVPVLTNAQCSKFLRRKGWILKTSLCAGYYQTRKDSCTGDSGGPLMVPQLNSLGKIQYYQIGVVSWGQGCGNAFKPGVYARVTEYIDWIEENLDL